MREAVKPDDLARVIEADQVAHPAEQRDVGDAVAFVHYPLAVRQSFVEHAQQPRRFGRVAVARPLVLIILAGEFVEEAELTEQDRKSTRLNSSHSCAYRMPSSA